MSNDQNTDQANDRENAFKLFRDAQEAIDKDTGSGMAKTSATVRILDSQLLSLSTQNEMREDANLMQMISQSARQKLQKNKVGMAPSLNFSAFTERFAKYFQDTPDVRSRVHEWGKFSRGLGYKVPTIDNIQNPIRQEKKHIKRRTGEQIRVDKTKQKRPGKVDADDMQQGANQQSELIQSLWHILAYYEKQNEDKAVPLYYFLLNPQHFNQSVENMFYLSFLVRDGNIGLSVEDNEPYVFTIKDGKTAGHALPTATRDRNQLALDLDQTTAAKLCIEYGIEEPLIPTREFDEKGDIINLHEYAKFVQS